MMTTMAATIALMVMIIIYNQSQGPRLYSICRQWWWHQLLGCTRWRMGSIIWGCCQNCDSMSSEPWTPNDKPSKDVQQNSKQEWCLDLFFLFPSQGAGRIMGALWNSHADKVDIVHLKRILARTTIITGCGDNVQSGDSVGSHPQLRGQRGAKKSRRNSWGSPRPPQPFDWEQAATKSSKRGGGHRWWFWEKTAQKEIPCRWGKAREKEEK